MDEELKMEDNANKVRFTKSSTFVLPVISVLCIILGFCFFFVNDFKADLSTLIIWMFFVVIILYVAVSIIDVIMRKDKKKLLYTIIMSAIALVADAFYIIAFYVG